MPVHHIPNIRQPNEVFTFEHLEAHTERPMFRVRTVRAFDPAMNRDDVCNSLQMHLDSCKQVFVAYRTKLQQLSRNFSTDDVVITALCEQDIKEIETLQSYISTLRNNARSQIVFEVDPR